MRKDKYTMKRTQIRTQISRRQHDITQTETQSIHLVREMGPTCKCKQTLKYEYVCATFTNTLRW